MHTKILLAFFSFITILSIVAAYYKFIVIQDYMILIEVPCTKNELCFVPECELDACTEEHLKNNSYTIIEIQAATINKCFSEDSLCINNICMDNPSKCTRIPCNPENEESCIKI